MRLTLSYHKLLLIIVVCCALVASAGCGGATPTANHNLTPTVNAKGAATPATPTPEHLPYTFPAAWRNTPGPLAIGGASQGFAFAPSNQQVGYACVSGSAPFTVTGDGGATWRAASHTPFSSCTAVFVNGQDASDVFVSQPIPYPANPAQSEGQLWRSRDGAASWQKLGMIANTGFPLVWGNVAVIGARLIGSVYVNGEGSLQNTLFFSDDGGMTWSQLAQSIASQGYTLDAFVATDSTIYIEGAQGNGASGSLPQPNAAGCAPLALQCAPSVGFSGSPPVTPTYWRSTDGGDSWTQVWSSVTLAGGLPTFVRAANGSGYYALAMSAQSSNENVNDATLIWSSDGGATWKQLPDLQGVENGYVFGGGLESALAPDGTVFAAGQHSAQAYNDDAGIFVIHPADASPAWSPLAAGGVQDWQATTTPTGLRLWGVSSFEGDQYLKYVDVA